MLSGAKQTQELMLKGGTMRRRGPGSLFKRGKTFGSGWKKARGFYVL
jgi:hypothetical protein